MSGKQLLLVQAKLLQNMLDRYDDLYILKNNNWYIFSANSETIGDQQAELSLLPAFPD